ncbi:hypothetical protein LRP49_04555 [Enterovibrio sp. ZSDZ35]|uniref:Uncharacterized protein n=1 Tax=Enterovibrio qingdaonensis TaxID=2899818 RepID=A0ABT5QJK0_9GAMM|nr:hypothetical protein [Enterovibrio sp. ZSDZ35]MDD1780466.1 hypothetical protein [Enterovibrio sp. ZSDZ35]
MSMLLKPLNDNQQVEIWEFASSVNAQERAIALAEAFVSITVVSKLPEWTVAGRDHLLLLAYQLQFGDAISVEGRCAECDAKNQLGFSASQILGLASTELYNAWNAQTGTIDTDVYLPRYGEITVRGLQCRFRLPCMGDLRALEYADDPLLLFAQRVINPVDFAAIKEVFSAMEDSKTAWEQLFTDLEDAMLALEPLSIVTLNASCPECGAETAHQFDIAHQFWAQLSANVEKQLWDVHLLASAYGWSSQDILGMSPARRRRHIAMIIE